MITDSMSDIKVASWSTLQDRVPTYALAGSVDLVVIKYDDQVSVLFGRCLHRGALMSDGSIDGDNLICGLHGWDYRYNSGVSEYNNDERLHKFTSTIDVEQDAVYINKKELETFENKFPQPYQRKQYLGLYQDISGTPDESTNSYIQKLARDGLSKLGSHGEVTTMGIPPHELPSWNDIQIVTAQLATSPLLETDTVHTNLVVGPEAKKPLHLDIPIIISDMSYGAISEESKIALAMGAEKAGTGICSGEGGMLPEEQQANTRYFYELASGMFGWNLDLVTKCQSFHFKAGQGAKTGTGGHLPGHKVTDKIGKIRNIDPGTSAISPSRFESLTTPKDYKKLTQKIRERSGGIPIGFKMSAQHIEDDIDFALDVGVDYIILDGRGGATGAAPTIFRDHISVPTLAALARARKHLNTRKKDGVTLFITGGLRTETDFVKALALGADGIAISNSALQAIGCLSMRACHTGKCPVGIATQDPALRTRLNIEKSAERLENYLSATTQLMSVLARACGHSHLNQFEIRDLTTWKRDIAYATGVAYAGIRSLTV